MRAPVDLEEEADERVEREERRAGQEELEEARVGGGALRRLRVGEGDGEGAEEGRLPLDVVLEQKLLRAVTGGDRR